MQLNARIKHKRDTASNWTTKNPTPLDGEVIIVETIDGNTRVKVGDGSTAYNNLPFMNEDLTIQVSENTSNITTLTNTKVTGVNSATSGNVVIFDGNGGRLIKDSGKSLDSYLPLGGGKMSGGISWGDTTLVGSNGSLTWGGDNIVRSINGLNADTSGNVNVLIPPAYVLPTATSSVIGGVKVGSNITNTDGKISLSKSNVTSALGYTPVKSVNGSTVDSNGNVSVSSSGPAASSSTMGGIKPASAWVKILESTSNIGTYSYTATKNCFVCAYNMGGTNNMTVMASIGGVTVFRDYGHHNDGNNSYPMFYLSKGQTITLTQNSAKLHFSVLYLE